MIMHSFHCIRVMFYKLHSVIVLGYSCCYIHLVFVRHLWLTFQSCSQTSHLLVWRPNGTRRFNGSLCWRATCSQYLGHEKPGTKTWKNQRCNDVNWCWRQTNKHAYQNISNMIRYKSAGLVSLSLPRGWRSLRNAKAKTTNSLANTFAGWQTAFSTEAAKSNFSFRASAQCAMPWSISWSCWSCSSGRHYKSRFVFAAWPGDFVQYNMKVLRITHRCRSYRNSTKRLHNNLRKFMLIPHISYSCPMYFLSAMFCTVLQYATLFVPFPSYFGCFSYICFCYRCVEHLVFFFPFRWQWGLGLLVSSQIQVLVASLFPFHRASSRTSTERSEKGRTWDPGSRLAFCLMWLQLLGFVAMVPGNGPKPLNNVGILSFLFKDKNEILGYDIVLPVEKAWFSKRDLLERK